VSREIRKSVSVDAPADAVWRAITEADELTQWFPAEARVTPGVGGSIWLSWGPGTEGEAPITAWDPGHRLQWTESRGPVKLAVDFHLETEGDRTVVRLVQSGFGDNPEWDDEFHMTDGGWSYFVAHLKWYLERHRGTRRELIAFREPLSLSRAEAFLRLVGPTGLSTDDRLSALEPGTPYRTSMALGDPLSGVVVASSPDTFQLGLTIDALDHAILFVEIEPAPSGARAGFWLSTYGLGPERVAHTRARFERLYRGALSLA
jgi:uncharacterized protein YndB with AHSA1/START domain